MIVYVLDFGEQNMVSPNIDDIIEWIKADMEGMELTDSLQYTIKQKKIISKQYDELPEWGG